MTATEAVFKVLHRRISDGEIQDVKYLLLQEIVILWPEAA